MIIEHATGSANYFGEILIQNPIQHPAGLKAELDPTKVRGDYRFEVLKHVLMMLDLHPLIEAGAVNFFPDPCNFDPHLRHQMMRMAEARTSGRLARADIDPRTKWLHQDDFIRACWGKSEEGLRADILKSDPSVTEDMIERMLKMVRDGRPQDPLASLRLDESADGTRAGYAIFHNMVPNFEMTLLIAQATGSIIVTDSPYRWREVLAHAWFEPEGPQQMLPTLSSAIESSEHLFLLDTHAVKAVLRSATGQEYRSLLHDALRYLATVKRTGAKPNWESQLPGRFARAYAAIERAILKTGTPTGSAKVKCIIPAKGIRDNTINRLLVTSSVDHYAESVPMAFFLERPDPSAYPRYFPSTPWAPEPGPAFF
jgi:hypothetical protein